MTAERTLEIIQQQPEGRILLGPLAQQLQDETLPERTAGGLKPLYVKQVQRWVEQLERDGAVRTTYLRRQGRPLEVAAREYQCPACGGSGKRDAQNGYIVECGLCDGAGMVTR